ncbi:carboxypeptidase-like regulatory domain-containing protein [Saccharicrinis fermentans]|uniref:Outer membrane cobalamin receptor protein n=1 Tax=Saccharicrinis fermentans DSM 9555 = JCM 21142 TaxID=869213 RepID=W7Y185_9BACT|nr:carboxypeptidase-like regulatory domain-containing protein [Saccharicrinis fermentans]GAF04675.1 outer membrane cobalamin receptor protein [Saccharicrinis fermentans DSM 9555 = JCM 21142]
MLRNVILILYLLVTSIVYSQNIALSGSVVNGRGEPISFATVYAGQGKGTCCDINGRLELQAEYEFPLSIVISAIGFKTDTFLVSKPELTKRFVLKEQVSVMDEVYVKSSQKLEIKSVASAFTTDKAEIQQLRPRNINEVLQNKAGFTNKSGYQAPLTLRGMSGKRLLVLRNNTRRFSSYPSGFMTHTINIYDLERIEVQIWKRFGQKKEPLQVQYLC